MTHMTHLTEMFHAAAQVRNVRGEWREVRLGRGIKALVVLNLQSYAGGRDLWGLRDPARDAAKGWQTPIFNDGVIEARFSGDSGIACPRGLTTCGF